MMRALRYVTRQAKPRASRFRDPMLLCCPGILSLVVRWFEDAGGTLNNKNDPTKHRVGFGRRYRRRKGTMETGKQKEPRARRRRQSCRRLERPNPLTIRTETWRCANASQGKVLFSERVGGTKSRFVPVLGVLFFSWDGLSCTDGRADRR